MDSTNILATLAKLEESITGIDSAKKQVDDVVKGYCDAMKAFGEVAKVMNIVQANVDAVIKAIKEKSDSLDSEAKEISTAFKANCDNAIMSTKDSLESAQKTFEHKIETSVSSLHGKIEGLGVCVTSITKLRDEIISALAKIDALGKQVNDGKTEIIVNVGEKSDAIKESVLGLSSDMAAKSSEILRSETEQSNTLVTILSSIESIKVEQENNKKQLNDIIKRQKATKIISIITMVIVVIGILLFKL